MGHFIEAFGSTLIYSLVAGGVLALIQGSGLLFLRNATPAIRYNFLLVLFFIYVASCAAVFMDELLQPAVSVASFPLLPNMPDLVKSNAANVDMPAFDIQVSAYFERFKIYVFATWFVFFFFKLLKLVREWRHLRYITSSARSTDNRELSNVFERLRHKLSIGKKVTLRVTNCLHGPTVVGILRPVILLPLSLVNGGLTTTQLEAILVHEMAHIRRMDFLVNLLQSITDNFLFFNPFYLWLSRSLRQEREYCCDQFAVKFQGEKEEYVRSLVSAYEFALKGSGLAVSFASHEWSMVRRVERIMKGTYHPIGYVPFAGIVVTMITLAIFFSSYTVAENTLLANDPEKVSLLPALKRTCTNPNHVDCNNVGTNDRRSQKDQHEWEKAEKLSDSPAITAILRQLLQHKIIASVKGVRFVLTKNEMIVNGVVRVDCVYEQLADRYLVNKDRLSFGTL